MTLALTLSLIVAALAIGLVVVSLRTLSRGLTKTDEPQDFDGSF